MIDYKNLVKKSGEQYLEYIKFPGFESVVHFDDQIIDLDIALYLSKKTASIHIFYVNIINECYKKTPIDAKGDYEKRAEKAAIRALGDTYKAIAKIIGASPKKRKAYPEAFTLSDVVKAKK